MKEIVFSKKKIDISPKESFILKFPEFTLSLMRNNDTLFAEIVKKKARDTFKGSVKENKKDFETIVKKLMKNLNQIVEVQKGK